ncbi:MAG: phosphatase PAP2 family protein, partial [Chloroflexi bacterium]|nr:phosphatase PAP2 family protein [Chloroflexota bacterium]
CVVLFRAMAIARRWVAPLAIYALLMAFSLVYLGEHYVFDVLVGVLIAMAAEVALRLIGLVEARRMARTR